MGALMSWLFFVEWSDIDDALPAEAESAFAEAVYLAGGGPPYLEVETSGGVRVRRELEASGRRGFDTLTLMAWLPVEERIVRIDYPRWFVRIKTSSSIDLGTMISAARRDWGHLDLSVSYGDLMNLGPALILDHRLENGARIMLWTSVNGTPESP